MIIHYMTIFCDSYSKFAASSNASLCKRNLQAFSARTAYKANIQWWNMEQSVDNWYQYFFFSLSKNYFIIYISKHKFRANILVKTTQHMLITEKNNVGHGHGII